MRALVPSVALIVALAITAAASCGGEAQTSSTLQPSDAAPHDGARDAGFLDLTPDGSRPDAEPAINEFVVDDLPPDVGADGWANLRNVDCPVQFAATPEALGSAIPWVPCDVPLGLPSGTCTRVAIDVPDASTDTLVYVPIVANVSGTHVNFAANRGLTRYVQHLIFDERGVVLAALRVPRGMGCFLNDGGTSGGKFALTSGIDTGTWREGVLLRGTIGGNVVAVKKYRNPMHVYVVPTSAGVIEYRGSSSLKIIDWVSLAESILGTPSTSGGEQLVSISESAPGIYGISGTPYSAFRYQKDALPIRVVAGGRDAFEVSTVAVDTNRIVWTSHRPAPDQGAYLEDGVFTRGMSAGIPVGPRYRVPATLGTSAAQSAMGCGIYVRTLIDPRGPGQPAPESGGIEIFNFNTMRKWTVRSNVERADKSQYFSLGDTFAATCDDVYVRDGFFEPGLSLGQSGIARIHLASLGVGEEFVLTPEATP